MAYLDDAGRKLVSEAATAAESATSGEIVTVLAERSDGYIDVALLWAAGAAFTAMSVFAAFPQPFLDAWDEAFGGWDHEWTTGELASLVIALGLAKFLAVMLVQQWEPLKFALIPGPLKTMRVHDQAVRQFKVGAERRTTGRTGVMIYLSMREHRAEIVADESIAAKVPAEVWGEAMGDMLSLIRKGQVAEGLAVGISDVGHVLAEHFPRGSDDDNELPDRLIEV
jgi:putative membrane protein